MIVLIPYKDDGVNGHELRYGIRSMVRHFKEMTGVCLIGDKPTWYTGEYIPMKDGGRKEQNIVSKVLSSPYETFLYSNDDFFALKDFDSSLPNYYSMQLKYYKGGGRYPERVKAVMELYPEGLMYDTHTPIVINLTAYKDANSKAEWDKKDYLAKSVYGNFIGGGEQLDDYKLKTGKVIDMNQPFFSTNNMTGRLIRLYEIYPDASQYEKS